MKSILLSFAAILMLSSAFAQVGIGTPTPSISAQLEVNSSTRGFLPPRVALTATNATSPITSPVAGLLVYNTATDGTAPNNVTPGFYYYDGVRWQRIINTPDATVEFNTANPNSTTPVPTFTPNTPQSANYVYVSTIDNSQWTWNGTTYVTYTPPASTPWILSGGTNDAGSNKTSSIYRSGKVGVGGNTTPNATLDIRPSPTSTIDPGAGFLGVGTTTSTASAAGAGAVRYSNSTGGVLEYSNGSNWNTLTSTVTKTVVTGYFSGTYTTGEQVLSCTETSDVSNRFTTNAFTAPRTGLYLVTANLLASSKAWVPNEELSIIFTVNGVFKIVSPFFAQANVTTFGGPTISAVIAMNAGDVGQFKSFDGVSSYTLYGENYNRFSITEL